jgi:hypothetical protein
VAVETGASSIVSKSDMPARPGWIAVGIARNVARLISVKEVAVDAARQGIPHGEQGVDPRHGGVPRVKG